MARFYSDENFPQPVVEALRALGHDVLTSLDAGDANQRIEDPKVLADAASLGPALLTVNRRDFLRLHNAGAGHQGIIACTQDIDFAGQAKRIDEEVRKHTALTWKFVRTSFAAVGTDHGKPAFINHIPIAEQSPDPPGGAGNGGVGE